MYDAHPHFLAHTFRKKIFHFNFLIHFFIIYKTNYRIPGHHFAYGYRYCFQELHFKLISINKRIKNIYAVMELVLPLYNVHPYFTLQHLGPKTAHSTQQNMVTVKGREVQRMLYQEYWLETF